MDELTPAERVRAKEIARSLGAKVEEVEAAMKQKARIAKVMAEDDCTERSAVLQIILESCMRYY